MDSENCAGPALNLPAKQALSRPLLHSPFKSDYRDAAPGGFVPPCRRHPWRTVFADIDYLLGRSALCNEDKSDERAMAYKLLILLEMHFANLLHSEFLVTKCFLAVTAFGAVVCAATWQAWQKAMLCLLLDQHMWRMGGARCPLLPRPGAIQRVFARTYSGGGAVAARPCERLQR